MIEFNKGTKEFLIIQVDDLEASLTTLDGTSPIYDVYSNDDLNEQIVSGEAAVVDVLKARCLIDDSADDYSAREYKAYLTITSLPEQPRLGPVFFRMNSV